MSQPNPNRIAPATADQLLKSHPDVHVSRDRVGVIEVRPESAVSRSDFSGFRAFLHMAFFENQMPGSALCISAKSPAGLSVTRMLIPTFGHVDDKVVTDYLRVDPDSVIDMATEGVQLLDDLHNLRPDERDRFDSIPNGDRKVRDDMKLAEPDISSENLSKIPADEILRGTLAVARRILLEA